MSALTVWKAAKSPMLRVPERSLLPLLRDFLIVCDTGNLPAIRQFHKDQILTHPHLFCGYKGTHRPLYSTFMGTVYCTLPVQDERAPINHWFHGLSTEIHRLY